jgi:hypothetical protein
VAPPRLPVSTNDSTSRFNGERTPAPPRCPPLP